MAVMPPSEHIKDIIVTHGSGYAFGGTSDWTVRIGKQPDNPDRCVTVYDSGGLASNPKWLIDYPSVQIRLRGRDSDYQLLYQKAHALRDLLVGRDSYTASNDDRIVSITAIGNVASVGRDDNDRPEIVLNLQMIIEPNVPTGTHREPL